MDADLRYLYYHRPDLSFEELEGLRSRWIDVNRRLNEVDPGSSQETSILRSLEYPLIDGQPFFSYPRDLYVV